MVGIICTEEKRPCCQCGEGSSFKKKSRKYCLLIPMTFEEAYALDKQDNATHWRDVIAKKMKNMMVVFKVLSRDDKAFQSLRYT